MIYYINSAARWDGLIRDFKELVPMPEIRRRMSRVLRMSVATGMEALAKLPSEVSVDAIITATRLGCLADSEKFLHNVIESGGEFASEATAALLNPTPFIQSTFNTVGAQIALLTRNHCYNVTYVHGEESFEAALVDTMIQIDQAGAEHVLVGLFDESTPTLEQLKARMRGVHELPERDGACFFVVSARPLPGCLAEFEKLTFRNFEEWLWS